MGVASLKNLTKSALMLSKAGSDGGGSVENFTKNVSIYKTRSVGVSTTILPELKTFKKGKMKTKPKQQTELGEIYRVKGKVGRNEILMGQVPIKKYPVVIKSEKPSFSDKNEEQALGRGKREVRIGDALNFTNIYRVMGKSGLFTLRGKVTNSGMAPVLGFMDYERKFLVVHRHLTALSTYNFLTYAGHDDLTMKDVLNNLDKYDDEGGDFEVSVKVLMEVMAPNHDPYEFKDYHAKMVLKWYKEISTKLDEIEEDAERSEKKN